MMDCSYCRLRHTCDKYAEALRTPTYIAGCCTAFTFDTSRSDDAFVYRVRQPMTNGDRIRAMSDEELAKALYGMQKEVCKHIAVAVGFPPEELDFADEAPDILDWLKQPVEVDHDTD